MNQRPGKRISGTRNATFAKKVTFSDINTTMSNFDSSSTSSELSMVATSKVTAEINATVATAPSPGDSTITIIVASALAVVVGLALCTASVLLWRRHSEKEAKESTDDDETNSTIAQVGGLGDGEYGSVELAHMTGESTYSVGDLDA